MTLLATLKRRHLPAMLVATSAVVVVPVLTAWALRDAAVIGGLLPVMAVGAGLSFLLSSLGAAYWKRRARTGDYTFRELMLWSWLWRLYGERRLDRAVGLLGRGEGGPAGSARNGSGELDALSPERRAKLLAHLASALEHRDPYTHGHSRRVARHAEAIARRMGLPSAEVERIRTAAMIHDVGKVNTPRRILHKPGPLTEAEFAVIRRHSTEGARMTEPLGDPELTRIVRHHHEWLDGTGYPDGLAGDDVPLGARVIAVADTFDALTSARPYRDALPHLEALRLLRQAAGTQLDVEAVDAFANHYTQKGTAALGVLAGNLSQRAGAAVTRALDAGGAAATKALAVGGAVGVLAGASEVGEPASASGAPETIAGRSAPGAPGAATLDSTGRQILAGVSGADAAGSNGRRDGERGGGSRNGGSGGGSHAGGGSPEVLPPEGEAPSGTPGGPPTDLPGRGKPSSPPGLNQPVSPPGQGQPGEPGTGKPPSTPGLGRPDGPPGP